MWIYSDKQFQREREHFKLKSCCEECVHYCRKRDACAMQYPVDSHRLQAFDKAKEGERIYFCKLFEAK